MRQGDRVRIRPAVDSDLKVVEDIAREAYQVYVNRMGNPPEPMYADYKAELEAGNLYILTIDQAIAAFAVYELGKREIFIDNLAVRTEFQSKGISAQMGRMLEEWGRDNSVFCIKTYTNALMTENVNLYRIGGYRISHRIVENGFDRVYMEKRIVAKETFPYFFSDNNAETAKTLLELFEQLPGLTVRWNLSGFRLLETSQKKPFGWVVVPGHQGWRGSHDVTIGVDKSQVNEGWAEKIVNYTKSDYLLEYSDKANDSDKRSIVGITIPWERVLADTGKIITLVEGCVKAIK